MLSERIKTIRPMSNMRGNISLTVGDVKFLIINGSFSYKGSTYQLKEGTTKLVNTESTSFDDADNYELWCSDFNFPLFRGVCFPDRGPEITFRDGGHVSSGYCPYYTALELLQKII